MDIYTDKRVVMTLDAGGTNFVFSAIKGGIQIIPSIEFPSHSSNLEVCLETLIHGFSTVKNTLPETPVAISFAFPGPADYSSGIIGDLPNFPAFRGGVALGPMLENIFKIPTIINNDGDLFTLGEAVAGFLPQLNKSLKNLGRSYENLIGITLGTGFGGGVVIGGTLYRGDNSASGEMWLMRNFQEPRLIAEEGISIRGIQRFFQEFSEDPRTYSPKQIYEMALGPEGGNQAAAIAAFEKMAVIIGESLANAITLLDAPVVIGGGLSGASEFLLPGIVRHLNGKIENFQGKSLPRVVSQIFNLENTVEYREFHNINSRKITVPGSLEEVVYRDIKAIPIGISKLGTSHSISFGAYAVALAYLDQCNTN